MNNSKVVSHQKNTKAYVARLKLLFLLHLNYYIFVIFKLIYLNCYIKLLY